LLFQAIQSYFITHYHSAQHTQTDIEYGQPPTENSMMIKEGAAMKRKELTGIFGCVALLFFVAIGWTAPVPDTGQTACYDVVGNMINCPSPGQALYGQDANYTINPRSYTKLSGSGNTLPDSATSWVTVRDNVSGLIWEMKTNGDGVKNYDDPHDFDNTYTWYNSNPATNGGYAGNPGDGTNTEAFLKALNDAHYGGYSDWRLPTFKELTYIVNFSIPASGPTIDTGYFPNTQPVFYWSGTTNASSMEYAWGVNFYYGGYDINHDKWYANFVRAVRGGQPGLLDDASAAADVYTSNGDGTVTDTSTGLTWQQVGSSTTMTWARALAYCEGLNLAGHTDWRLPTIKELRSLVDYNRYNPAINATYFPNTMSSVYWSSTTYANSTNGAWAVNFYYGNDDSYDKDEINYQVRAVRGEQSGSLAASFAGSGLWVYKADSAAWTQVSSANPENMIYSGSTLYVDFGASYGLCKWDGAAWAQLTSANSENMVTSGSTLYVDFGASGICKWDGAAWTQLTSANPENMVTSGSKLYVNFGAAYGLYQWDGVTWSQLTSASPENMVTSALALYVDFGASGLYKWNGTAWSQLASANPENMAASNSALYVDFGTSYGLYQWDGATWSQLTSASPENMVTSALTLYVDLGASGLYKREGSNWSQLTGSNPVIMAVSN
jgi:hypothetical protein